MGFQEGTIRISATPHKLDLRHVRVYQSALVVLLLGGGDLVNVANLETK